MFEAVVLDDPIAGDRESLFAAMEGRILAMLSLGGSTRAAGARREEPVEVVAIRCLMSGVGCCG